MIRFRWLTGDMDWQTYGGKWISQKCNNGEFDYWLVLEFMNWYDAVGKSEAPAHYHVSLHAVAPSQVGEREREAAKRSCGLDNRPTEFFTDEIMVELLDSYGVKAVVWQQNGNNCLELLREAKRQAQCVEGLFGFYMDPPQNRIGSTGWDMLRGDLDAALHRPPFSDEKNLVRKIQGLEPKET